MPGISNEFWLVSKFTIINKVKMMKISHFLSAAVLGLSSVAVNAAVIDFNIAAPTAGTISYDGIGGSLMGTAIEVDSAVGIDTPANSGALGILTCDECLLDFSTGANTGGWTFGGGGTISITGTLLDANDVVVAAGNLLTGSWTGSSVISLGNSFFSFEIVAGSFTDTKNEGLTTYFGMPTGEYIGGINLSFAMATGTSVGSAFTSTSVYSGDVVNTPAVPVPAAVWLFGSGLIGLVGVARRRA